VTGDHDASGLERLGGLAAVGPVERNDGWYAILDDVRQPGEKDLALATELGDRLGVDTPLGDHALAHLAEALGVVPRGAGGTTEEDR
jgi:hypothetical protein